MHRNSIGKSEARNKRVIKVGSRRHLYFVLMRVDRDSHRFFILPLLLEVPVQRITRFEKERTMLDLLLLALGLALFVLSIGYVYACDRL